MNWETNQSKAIPFIIKDQSDTYCLTPQAEEFLNQLQGPLTIITVAGLYRTGKSYLLNRVILNRASGFGVGPTVNPCTKGLWLWAEQIRAPQGRTLLVIDTEGLGALDEESNHDLKIFSLAVLLSTNFIYNSVGSIDQTALQTLSLALQLIGSIDRDNYSSRPSLLWVIRDFSLELINSNGQAITSSDYLELALSTEHIKETSKVSIRKIINQAFSKRDCCTLIKPVIDEQKLQTLDKVPPEELRPEFVSQTIALRKNILSSLKEMKLNSSGPLSGKQYAIMVGKYLAAINAGQVPNLMDTWSFIKAEKARAAFQIVRDNYNQKLRTRLGSRLPLPSSKLSQLLSGLRKEAIQQFQSLSYQQTIHEDLMQFLTLCENEMVKVNSKETKNVFGDILRRQFQPFQKKLLSDYYTDVSSYQTDLKQTFTKKIAEKIVDKIDVPLLELDLFTERKIVEAAKLFERKAKEETIRIRELKNQAQNSLQQELRKIGRVHDEQRRKYQEELMVGERKIITLTTQKQRLEDALDKERKEEAIEAEKFRRKTEENQGTLQHLTSQTQRLSALNSDQERLIFSLKKQLEKEKALYVQKQEYMTVKLQEQQKRIQQLSLDLNRQVKQWEQEKRQLVGSNETQLNSLLQENKELSDQLQEAMHQLEHEKYIRNQHEQEISQLKSRFQEEVQLYKERLNTSNKKENRKGDDEELTEKYQQMRQNLAKSQRETKQWQTKCKQMTQNLKSLKNTYEKQAAIFNQKMEFQQIQISELKAKNVQLNESYQRYLEHAHTDNKGVQEMYSNKINEMYAENQKSLRLLEEEYQKKVKDLKKQLIRLTSNNEDLELQINLQRKKSADLQSELKEAVKKSEQAYEQMIQRLNNMEMDQSAVQKEKELFYQGRIKQLEQEMEAINEKNTFQLEDYSKKTQQNLLMLKNYADMERAQWEKRLEEEKQKNNRKLNDLNEDWSRRLSEEKEPLEAQVQELAERLEMTEMQAREQIQSLKCDYDIKLQKINNTAIQQRMELNKRLALTIQEAQMTKNTLLSQLEEKTKTFQQTLNSVKKQLVFECEQQIRTVKEALQESQQRNDGLRKVNRKAEENNFLMRSELDKEKAVFRQKLQNLSKERRQLEQRYLTETQTQNKTIEDLSSSHTTQTRRLNEDIQRLRHKLQSSQQQIMMISNEKDQERQSYITKNNYLEGKIKRLKDDNEDLLRKFQTTVKTLSKNNKGEIEKEFQERLSKLKDDYHRKIVEKEDSINQERRERDDKLIRLQTENKTLRDRLLIFQMRESGKKGRNEDYEAEFNRMQEQYQRKLKQMEQEMKKYAKLYMQTREEKNGHGLDSMVKSKISDRSERHSFISEAPSLDVNTNKGLRQNKSMLNYKLPAGTTKKQEKRYTNVEEGIMRWQQH